MQDTIHLDNNNVELLRSKYSAETVKAYLFSMHAADNGDLKKFIGFFDEFKELYLNFSPEQGELDMAVLLSVITDIDQTLPSLSQHYQQPTQALLTIQKSPNRNKEIQISKSQGILKQEKIAIEKMLSDYLLYRLNILSAVKLAKKKYCELQGQHHPLELLTQFASPDASLDKTKQHLPIMIMQILTRFCQEQENKAQVSAHEDVESALKILAIEREIVSSYTDKHSHQFELISSISQHKNKRLDKIESHFRAA